ncbi:MAG: hypothetical protein E6G68_04235 [Actinobacteria bacterium]|nr:MAG: hypothetical protein E6G68_04235 [Actinomycetota bacterium]
MPLILAVPGHATTEPPATPRADCGPGSDPETGLQGRVSVADVSSGRAYRGYRCNTEMRGHFGASGNEGGSGGYKVFRYVDHAGHECAFYDSTLLFPVNVVAADVPGVFVLDMTDPAHPVRTANLVTPAMLSPHESLSFNAARGLLAAGMGNPLTYPGVVDIYDASTDCRHPVLKSSTPMGLLGHEGNFTPDGNTLWISNANNGPGTLTAIDVSKPALPRMLLTMTGIGVHGMNVSDDGDRLYYADLKDKGLTILDTTQIQNRTPKPQVPVVSHLTWDTVSIPQNAIPFTRAGHPYLVEVDEFSRQLSSGTVGPPVGAARIIDIADDAHPSVVSDLRLEVNLAENFDTVKGDAGATHFLQGYTAHYCAVPSRVDPTIVACSFIPSGLRVFDIRDPYHPTEIAYFNMPVKTLRGTTSYAMSAAAFAPERREIWYSDGNSGFYNIHVTNDVWP